MSVNVSNKPWSDFKASDYSDDQWLKACLIDRGATAGTAKIRAKLPVREPDGTLNRNGMAAAAAAIGGARSPLKATPEEKASAKKKLASLYSTIGADAPDSLKHDATSADDDPAGLVLVALPKSSDYVHQVGDEEKHATILFLGDNVDASAEALIRASINKLVKISGWTEFDAPVSSVSSLDESARVWLLDNQNPLAIIRDCLLRDPAIRAQFDSQQQYPNYTPHVTIGYPAQGSPDNLLDSQTEMDATEVSSISFDRLALWYGKDHTVVWQLQPAPQTNVDDSSEYAMAQSDNVENFLTGFGVDSFLSHQKPFNEAEVKRNKSGEFARKDASSSNIAQEDLDWANALNTNKDDARSKLRKLLYDKAKEMSKDDARLKEIKKEFIDLAKKTDAKSEDRIKVLGVALQQIQMEYLNKASVKYGTSPKGGMQAVWATPFTMHVVKKSDVNKYTGEHLSHPTTKDSHRFHFNPKAKLDPSRVKDGGSLLDKVLHDDLSSVDDYLAHFGVKGMRWGVRRELSKVAPGSREDHIQSREASWLTKVHDPAKALKAGRVAARGAKKDLRQLNRETKDRGLDIRRSAVDRENYHQQVSKIMQSHVNLAAEKVYGRSNTGLYTVRLEKQPDGSFKAHAVFDSSNPKVAKQLNSIQRSDARNAKKAAKALMHADGDVVVWDDLEFDLHEDVDGFFDDISVPGDLQHDDEVLDDFLMHFGVKGMRWGVRRSDAQLGHPDGGGELSVRRKRKAQKDDVKEQIKAQAKQKALNEAVAAKIPHVSADAERTLNTLNKQGVEMSTREIKETLDRARQIQSYNEFFAPKGDRQLQEKVANLQLQKQYKDLQRELNPPKKSKAQAFIKAAVGGYTAYSNIDKSLNGKLSDAIGKKIFGTPPKSQLDVLKSETELFRARKGHFEAKSALDAVLPRSIIASPRSPGVSKLSDLLSAQVKDAQDLNKLLDDVLK